MCFTIFSRCPFVIHNNCCFCLTIFPCYRCTGFICYHFGMIYPQGCTRHFCAIDVLLCNDSGLGSSRGSGCGCGSCCITHNNSGTCYHIISFVIICCILFWNSNFCYNTIFNGKGNTFCLDMCFIALFILRYCHFFQSIRTIRQTSQDCRFLARSPGDTKIIITTLYTFKVYPSQCCILFSWVSQC